MLHRSFQLAELLRADGRNLIGRVVPWDVEIWVGGYRERFARGAFTGTDLAAVPLLVAHRHAALPIGVATVLDDQPDGLHGEFAVSETRDAEEVLALVADGVPIGLSVGFTPAPGGDHWTADRSTVIRTRAVLGEISVVGVPAYRDAMVAGVRAAQDPTERPLLRLARLLR